MNSLKELMKYRDKDPDYYFAAFAYADEYADGLFERGGRYGFVLGIIFTLVVVGVALLII